MKCPYMAGNYTFSCVARREVYVPSAFEFAEYCNCERYERFKVCSFYMEAHTGSQEKPSAESRALCCVGE